MVKYVMTEASRVDFTAYAPMHTFKGWAVQGLAGEIELDCAQPDILSLSATAATMEFETVDTSRTKAMRDYFQLARHSQASFTMTECRQFHSTGDTTYQADMEGVLLFGGIRRLVPITCALTVGESTLDAQIQCKWSFKAYGLKAPRLLFLTVRDIVDIHGNLHFTKSD